MGKANHITRAHPGRIRPRNLALVAEAMAGLTAASLKVRFLPFRHITSAILRGGIGRRPRPVNLARLRWAVQAAARRLPLRTMCFETALCLQAMLRRRGVPSTLHYGIRRGEAGSVSAHVWLSIGEEIVLGGEVAPQFACVATFSTPFSTPAAD